MFHRHPLLLVGAFVSIAALTSLFGDSLGTAGIVFIVGGTLAAVVFLPMLWNACTGFLSAHGEQPSWVDWALAPPGYRAPLALPEKAQSQHTSYPAMPLTPAMADLPVAAQYEERSRSISTVVDEACLDLAEGLQPPVRLVIGRAILCVGRRGMGKSTLAGRFLEQLGRFPLPMLVCDYEQDYASLLSVLPRAALGVYSSWRDGKRYSDEYGERVWQVSLENAEQVGRLILQEGVQLILQTSSFASLEMAAQVIVAIVDGMFEWAEERDPEERVPVLILLDEAQHFIPQSFESLSINRAEAMELLNTFQKINSIGRKRGFTSAIFGTRAAQINKQALSGAEIYFLLGTSEPVDLNRYRAILGKRYYQQDMINALSKGDVLVFEGGEPPVPVHMKERESTHRNVTPGLPHAQQRYGVNLPNFKVVEAFGHTRPETPAYVPPVTYYHAEDGYAEKCDPDDDVEEEEEEGEGDDDRGAGKTPVPTDPAEAFLVAILHDYRNHPMDHGIHAIARRQNTTPYYVRQAFDVLRRRGALPSPQRVKLPS